MKKSHFIVTILLIIPIWVILANPSVIKKVRPRLIDLMEFPLKAATRAMRGLYGLAAVQNRYEERIALLEKRIASLTEVAVRTRELSDENERLRNLLSFKSRTSLKGVGAEVIGRNHVGWDTFIIVDKGRKDGIRQGAAAVKSDGLVGMVIELGGSTAKIMLIDNPNSKVGATVQRTREQGLLVGIGGGMCRLKYMSYDTETRPGDIIIANPMGSLSTKGVLIGEVIKILKDDRALYATALVKPSSNLFKIEEVLCIE